MPRKRIRLGRLAHGVYNLLQAQANHKSFISLNLLHQSLGHPSISVMKQLPGLCNNLYSSLCDCFICFHAKQTRHPFSLSNKHSSNIFYLVHSDVWGPYKHKSMCGSSYLLTLVDDFSRATCVYLLIDKSTVCSYF